MVQRLAYLAFMEQSRGGRGSTPRNGIIFFPAANFKFMLCRRFMRKPSACLATLFRCLAAITETLLIIIITPATL